MARSKPQSTALGRMITDIAYARAARGSGIWLGIGILTTTGHVVKRLARRRREVVWRATLKPGATVTIDHLLRDRAGRTVAVRRGGRVVRVRG
jgi:hypothetical protein